MGFRVAQGEPLQRDVAMTAIQMPVYSVRAGKLR